MIDFLNSITPVLDVFGSVQFTTDHLHETGEVASHAAELAHTEEAHGDHAGHDHAEHDDHAAEAAGAAAAADADSHAGHNHGPAAEGPFGWLKEGWELITDPAHMMAEVFYNIATDLVVIPIAVLLYKKIREPKLRAAIHKEIDDEHGITHSDCNGSSEDKEKATAGGALR